MMAQPFAPPGMGPGHPVMPHGHPMGVPHPGMGHMGGQPGPVMQGMHPGVSGPQSQGPMVSGMPPGAGTPAPMQNQMAAMHMTPPGHMFQQPNSQMNLGQMQLSQQAAQMRTRMMMQQQQQAQQQAQQQQQHGVPMPNGPQFNPQQLAQLKMQMPMQYQQHMAQMQANQQQAQFQQQQQQRMMQQHQAAQQQAAFHRAQNQHAAAAQQMQMSRSQEPTSQPPQPQPTPAPQSQPAPPQPQPPPQAQPQAQPAAQAQPPQAQAKPQPQPQTQPNNQQGTPQPQIKPDGVEDEPQIKEQEMSNQIMLQDIPKQQQNDFTGQCILQLLLYQDNLANPERPEDIVYWEEIMQKYFSEYGSIRQQLFNNKMGHDKSFQLQYASLARFYYLHFTNGIKQILMQSFDHNQSKLPNGGIHIWSKRASLTYVFKNDIRVTTQGSLKVNFDDMQKIEHLYIATTGWTEYIPRNALLPPSPEQQKTSPKINKNQKKNNLSRMQGSVVLPTSPVSDFGLPSLIVQFLEIAEVMTAMGPLMDYFHQNPGTGPRQALMAINAETQSQQMQQMQHMQHMQQMQIAARTQQNANAMAMNNQLQFQQQQRAMNMQMPNQFQSPALQHLGLPQSQGSPHMGGPTHTPSPAHVPQGGIAMVHQMSAQGSNLSGSQNPSTNTSPNVSNKKRRQSAVKMEEEGQAGDGANRVKPSPRIGGKRQKGQA